MKTIEERAKEYSERDFFVKMSCSLTYKHCVEDAYTKGATEQKKIDDEEYRKDMRFIVARKQEWIDKACEWLNNELITMNTTDARYPTEIMSASYFTTEELINDFRKAMEE